MSVFVCLRVCMFVCLYVKMDLGSPIAHKFTYKLVLGSLIIDKFMCKIALGRPIARKFRYKIVLGSFIIRKLAYFGASRPLWPGLGWPGTAWHGMARKIHRGLSRSFGSRDFL